MGEAQQSGIRAETKALHARWLKEAEEFRSPPKEQPDDFLDRWLPAAAPHFDAGWNGDGAPPSQRLAMRYCMAHWADAERLSNWMKAEARARAAAGYHPFPLTNLRPAVSGPKVVLPND